MSKPKKNPSYLSIDNISTRTKKRFLHITSVLQQIDESKKESEKLLKCPVEETLNLRKE